ncbi:MAG: tyrosyl-tRNA synthetase [Patiriisocius sp.]|jgi:tyrosyl-tRNA synthetase
MKNFVEELKWRGMIHDMMPGTEEQLMKEMTSAYVGFDPTADSLHIGNLVPVMLLVHFQQCGHKPYVLVGGATGMVGDPSGKSEERNLQTMDMIEHNLQAQKKQLHHFLNFNDGENKAEVVNNYDWFKEFSFLDFIRDVGKHLTVNYMMAKDSVKTRLETGLSFTEFSYQLVQGYDFYWLKKNKNCMLQMGGSDQWGNITTGTELIRRMGAGEAYALTAPLIKKADGTKFGKTAGGSVWLDKDKTSPYAFYQYWINASDDDASKYIRIFTLLKQEEILEIEKQHLEDPGARVLQKALAKDVTVRVHGEEEYIGVIEASSILFGKATSEKLREISEANFLAVFEGVPQGKIAKSKLSDGEAIIEVLAQEGGFLKSKGEARRALKENSISVNKEKVTEEKVLGSADLINDKYVLLQRGKKNYYLLIAE